jgi:hypothetical protein
MTFQFIVEDGSLVANSNSYLTIDEANTYIQANYHVYPQWQVLDTLTKQQLLVWACRYLDQRATWNGVPTSTFLADPTQTNLIATWAVAPIFGPTSTQSMRWPRACVLDRDGNALNADTIPKQLKDACAEMARYLLANDRSLERPQDFLTELKAGDVTLRFRDAVLAIVPSEVSFIVRGLGSISSGRTNFSKITKV